MALSGQDKGVPPSGSGHQPTASAANASSQSGVPNAVNELRELVADETQSGEQIRSGMADILRGIDPLTLAKCGIV